MTKNGQAMKNQVLERLRRPENAGVEKVSRESEFSMATLERWQSDERTWPPIGISLSR